MCKMVMVGGIAVLTSLLPHTLVAQDEQSFMKGDSAFTSLEKHEVTPITEAGSRKGWIRRLDIIRFGCYTLQLDQCLDPATGFPPARRTWGDSFVGILGKRPRAYMSANWSPWDFLLPAIRLKGDSKDLPFPTLFGRVKYAVLRENTPDRIVGEVVWEDPQGGLTHARFAGWRGVNRFGMAVRYTPPRGREIESIRYDLVCQPYDIQDRGQWERRRWMATPLSDTAIPETPRTFDPQREWMYVFFNRYAQNDAGTFLAVDPATVREVAVQGERVVTLSLTPTAPATEVVALLGDWVDMPYSQARHDFFAQAEELRTELAKMSALKLSVSPPADGSAGQEIDSLLAEHPALAANFRAAVEKSRQNLQTHWTSLAGLRQGQEPPVPLAVAYNEATVHQAELYRMIKSEWMKRKLFAEPRGRSAPSK